MSSTSKVSKAINNSKSTVDIKMIEFATLVDIQIIVHALFLIFNTVYDSKLCQLINVKARTKKCLNKNNLS